MVSALGTAGPRRPSVWRDQKRGKWPGQAFGAEGGAILLLRRPEFGIRPGVLTDGPRGRRNGSSAFGTFGPSGQG